MTSSYTRKILLGKTSIIYTNQGSPYSFHILYPHFFIPLFFFEINHTFCKQFHHKNSVTRGRTPRPHRDATRNKCRVFYKIIFFSNIHKQILITVHSRCSTSATTSFIISTKPALVQILLQGNKQFTQTVRSHNDCVHYILI